MEPERMAHQREWQQMVATHKLDKSRSLIRNRAEESQARRGAMTSRRMLEETLRDYRRLKRDNPDLINEDLNAVLVAASNSEVALAIDKLRLQREGSPSTHREVL